MWRTFHGTDTERDFGADNLTFKVGDFRKKKVYIDYLHRQFDDPEQSF